MYADDESCKALIKLQCGVSLSFTLQSLVHKRYFSSYWRALVHSLFMAVHQSPPHRELIILSRFFLVTFFYLFFSKKFLIYWREINKKWHWISFIACCHLSFAVKSFIHCFSLTHSLSMPLVESVFKVLFFQQASGEILTFLIHILCISEIYINL